MSQEGSAAWGCSAILGCALLLGCVLGCAGAEGGLGPFGQARPGSGATSHVLPSPSAEERYCAWFGARRGDVLYAGLSPFWAELDRAGGDARGDMRAAGPQWIGRFDLAAERWLEPLDATLPGARSGIWDVLPLSDGRVIYTSYFEPAGIVDPRTGEVERLLSAGYGLNEIAPGPDGRVLVSRYGYAPDDHAAVVILDPAGRVERELPLESPDTHVAAAKSLAFDPLRREIWVNTDLIPAVEGEIRFDARVLDLAGRERLRFEHPETQFMTFADDGTGYFAEAEGRSLHARIRTPDLADDGPRAGRRVLLDDAYPADFDFVQEIQIADDGSALFTRWSGRLHRVWPDGRVESRELAAHEGGERGLAYTGVVRGGRVCVTRCSEVEVVCQSWGPPEG
ncbi:MAG: hypothetical protein QNK05_10645 [Myxococcota bacterium]|nr:hypothetical protein [Myxococcota bacterium]